MKIYTSYFYAVRFFKPYQIQFSTALWDPKWYHQFQGPKHLFIDKNGVLNGLRAERLHPDHSCDGLCRGQPCIYDYETCQFLKNYREQLKKIDVAEYIKKLEIVARLACKKMHVEEEPEIILLVHEAPTNPCSERLPLQEVFSCAEFDYAKPD